MSWNNTLYTNVGTNMMSEVLSGATMTITKAVGGSGTTAAVARQLGRHYIGIELNPDYCKLAEKRIGGVAV